MFPAHQGLEYILVCFYVIRIFWVQALMRWWQLTVLMFSLRIDKMIDIITYTSIVDTSSAKQNMKYMTQFSTMLERNYAFGASSWKRGPDVILISP